MRRKNIKIKQFPLNGARINSTSISKISREFFITGDSQNNVRLYEFDEDDQKLCLSSNTASNVQNQVSAVSLSVNEDQIFSGSNRGIINIWDIRQEKAINLLKGHSTSVNCFGIFPQDQSRVASGSYDTNIKLWNIKQKNCYTTLKGHTKQVNSIEISPDRNMLLSGSQDNTVRLWDLRYPEKLMMTYTQHSAPVIKVEFNPDDMMFASCSMDKTAKYFRCENPHFDYICSTDMLATPITAVTFDDEGKVLYTAANDSLKIWNMAKKDKSYLIESVESPWKGVQDIRWTPNGLLGVAAGVHHLSIWVFDEKQKVSNRKVMEKRQSDSIVFPNIHNAKKKQAQKDLMEVMNNVNEVMGNINNLQKNRKNKEQKQQPILSQQQKQKIKEEQNKKREQLQKQKAEKRRRRQQQQLKDREEKQRLKELRQQQERILTEQLQAQRIERQRKLQANINKTFEQQVPEELEATVQPQMLDNSTILNLSHFMVDGAQKQKLKQIEVIGQMLKDDTKFQSVMKHRMNALKPIIHFWKQGKIESALSIMGQTDPSIVSDSTAAILKSSKFKYAVSAQVAVKLLIVLTDLMKNKHATYVKSAMSSMNQIVDMFKDQLIKIKAFNPMTKNDPSRQERLAKYDRLIEEFLNVFKLERLKKYAMGKTSSDNRQLIEAASTLYKNLEDVLKKLVPKKEPEPA